MRVIRMDPLQPDARLLDAAAAWLRAGGVLVMPTDTLYGLAVDPRSDRAVADLFDLKGRAAGEALPLIASSVEQVEAAGGALGTPGTRLASRWWPGPLSLIIDAPPGLAGAVHAGRDSVAVRVPADAIARGICDAFGSWLTATSANRSGAPAVARIDDLDAVGRDPRVCVIDGGDAPGGAPSTIVDVRSEPRLVRAGAIAWERVLESLRA